MVVAYAQIIASMLSGFRGCTTVFCEYAWDGRFGSFVLPGLVLSCSAGLIGNFSTISIFLYVLAIQLIVDALFVSWLYYILVSSYAQVLHV